MNKNKRLGKGLEEISHLFMSSSEEEASPGPYDSQKQTEPALQEAIAARSICIVGGNSTWYHGFLVAHLSLVLGRLGKRVTVIDAGEERLCTAFIGSSRRRPSLQLHSQEDLTVEGSFGVRSIGLGRNIFSGVPSKERGQELCRALADLRHNRDLDLVLIAGIQGNVLFMAPSLTEIVSDFLVLVPPENEGMLRSYQIIKTILHRNPFANVGILVTEVSSIPVMEIISNKMTRAVRKFLDVKIEKYGFVFRIEHDTSLNSAASFETNPKIEACLSRVARRIMQKRVGEAQIIEQ